MDAIFRYYRKPAYYGLGENKIHATYGGDTKTLCGRDVVKSKLHKTVARGIYCRVCVERETAIMVEDKEHLNG